MGSEINVYTNLPPGVEGQVLSHLYIQIPYIIWNKKFKKYLKDKISVKVCWWGEKTESATFYPLVVYEKPHKNVPKTIVKYAICSDHTKFTAYLKDMERLHLKISSTTTVLGTTNIDKIYLITSNLQISGLFPVISFARKKIAELFIKITMEKFSGIEEHPKLRQTMDNTEEKQISFEHNRQHDTEENCTNNTVDDSDFLTTLLEKAENLRQAMIISLLENKNLTLIVNEKLSVLPIEQILESESKKFKDEEAKKSNLIETVLGIQKRTSHPLASTRDDNGIAILNDSTSSSFESKVNELSESFDSVPDDTVINELFYSDSNFGTLSQIHGNHRNSVSINMNNSKRRKSNKIIEKNQSKSPYIHQLSPEMRVIVENIKQFKVKVKDITFHISKTASKDAAGNSIQSLLQQNKARTFIVEFISPFYVKVGLWDHRGHRKETTDLLRFISRRVKQNTVSFEQEVTIPFETTMSADAIVEKELVFCAKARLHDIRKIIDLGSGSIKVKDCITVCNSVHECCISLHNNVETASGIRHRKYGNEVIYPTLRIAVSLVLSEFKLPVDKAVATSDDGIIIQNNDHAVFTHSVSVDGQPANKCDLILNEPLHCILQISEGKNFGEKKWLHIVCRLFFSKNAVFRDILYNPDEPTICFSQIFPILLNKELLKQTENNVMVIEVWERLAMSDKIHLKGLCKLPLHCFYLVLKNAALARSHLLSKYPIISTSGQTPVIHPVTGSCNGEFNILFALGTLKQIDNMLEECFYKSKTNGSSISCIASPIKHPLTSQLKSSARVPHILEVSVEELGGLKIASNMVWGEADCYVTYCFPTQENGEVKVHLYKSNSQLIMPDVIFKSIERFVFFLDEEEELESFLIKELTSDNNEKVATEKYPVKLWGNFYNPYQRTELLASTYLSLVDLCGMIRKAKSAISPSYHTFKLPFQRSFTNNCRLKVGYVKFNIAYWRHIDKEDSATVKITNIKENISDSAAVQISNKKDAEDIFISMTESDHCIRDVSTETQTQEIISEIAINRQDDIPERDDSTQIFSDKMNSKIHQNNEPSNMHFPAPAISQSNISNEFHSKNKDFTFNAHVVVERALHLPRISDKGNKDVAPSTYVTFNTDDQTEFITNVVEETCDPVWNWHHDVTFSTAHPSVRNGVNLVFKLLHQENDESYLEPAKDKVLGTAVLELTPLLHGLNKISGWYNIADASGKCQGQIKISITPERNEVFQQMHCVCTIQPDRSKQNNIAKKNSSIVSSQRMSTSLPSSPSLSLKKQLEELDMLHSYLLKRIAQLPVTNKGDEFLQSNSNERCNGNTSIKQLHMLNEGKEAYQDNSLVNCARNNLFSNTEDIQLMTRKDNSSRDGQSNTKQNSEKKIDCAMSNKVLPCSIHFSSGKQPVFNTPISPQKKIQYTTYIHSKCINSSSSLHALQHEDGTNCDYCDKLEVINSTVETIDLSLPFNVQAVTGINTDAIDLTKQQPIADIVNKQDELPNTDKNNLFERLPLSSSPSVEHCRTSSSQSIQKDKKEEDETESSRDTLVESMEPV